MLKKLLSIKEKSAIIGMVLGDGYLQKTGEKNARLRLEHSAKQDKYLLWKISLLPRFFQGKPVYLERTHLKSKKTYKYIRHQSSSSPILGKIRKIFYLDNKKTIPQNLKSLLKHPLSLAIWYMDDGYLSKYNLAYLYLGKMSEEEAKNISLSLKNNFSIPNHILNKKNKGFVISFNRDGTDKLKNIIKNYIIPSMEYKLDYKLKPFTP